MKTENIEKVEYFFALKNIEGETDRKGPIYLFMKCFEAEVQKIQKYQPYRQKESYEKKKKLVRELKITRSCKRLMKDLMKICRDL